MLKQLTSVYKESLIYTIGNLANKVVGFILLPLYTRFISLSDYGILGLIEPFSQLLFTSLCLGLDSAFVRWYSVTDREEERKTIFFNVNLVLTVNTLLFVIMFSSLAGQISVLLFDTDQYALMLRLAFANVFFTVINTTFFSTLRIEHKAINYSLVRAVQFTITLLLNVYLIAFRNYGLLSVFVSQLVGSGLVFFFFVPIYIRHVRNRLQGKLLLDMLKFGLPVVPVGISSLFITMVNRYILEYYDTLASVGLFSFTFRLSNTIKILITESISLSLTPVLYQKLADKTGRRFIQKNYIYSIFFVMLVYIFSSSFSREFIYLFAQNKDYYDAYLLFPILGIVAIFNTITYFYQVLLNYAKATVRISMITMVTALFSIAVTFLTVPLLKSYGAALASVLSGVFLFLMFWYYSQKNYGSYFENRKVFDMLITGLGIVGLNYLFFIQLTFLNLVIKMVTCFAFPFILYLFNFYEPVEIDRIKLTARKILRLGR